MTEIFLAYAEHDHDQVAFVVNGLREAGFTVTTGYDDTSTAKPTDILVLDIKRAAAIVPLLTTQAESSKLFVEMFRAGLLYEKPLTTVLLDEEVVLEKLANNRAIRAHTVYQNQKDALAQHLGEGLAFYQTEATNTADFSARNELTAGTSKLDAQKASAAHISKLIEALHQKGITAHASSQPTTTDVIFPIDNIGLPKTDQSMLAHWNMLKADGSTNDLKQFAEDYKEDAYFSSLAENAIKQIQYKKIWRGAQIFMSSVLGVMVMGAGVYGLSHYCADKECFTASAASQMTIDYASITTGGGEAAQQLTSAHQKVIQLQENIERLKQERRQLTADNQNLNTQIAAYTQNVTALEQQLAAMKQSYNQLNSQLSEDNTTQSELSTINAQLQEANSKIEVAQGRIKTLENQLQTALNSAEKTQINTQNLQAKLEAAQQTINSLQQTAPNAQQQTALLQAELKKAQNEANALRIALQKAGLQQSDIQQQQQTEITTLQTKIQKQQKEITTLKAEAQQIYQQIENENHRLKARITILQQSKTQQERQIQALKQKLNDPEASSTPTTALLPTEPSLSASYEASQQGAEYILAFYQQTLGKTLPENIRSLESGHMQKLQQCISRHTGRVTVINGVWDQETHSALEAISHEEARWVVTCLQNSSEAELN